MHLPGDYVGTVEEFIPKYGLFEEDGKIYAAQIGELAVDKTNHTAKLLLKTRIPRMMSRGTKVFGRVVEILSYVVLLHLEDVNNRFSFAGYGVPGVIHISQIKDAFVRDIRGEFRIGDIVRAKITDVKPYGIMLTTRDPDLGVVKAFCSKCRSPLKRVGNRLLCQNCGNIERRKLSKDYILR